MTASLTEEEFSKHLNTNFRIEVEDQSTVNLELIQVKGYMHKPGEADGMERFSAFFRGPGKPLLPQGTYSLANEGMGKIDIFLVPIGLDAETNGLRYEAVFNYFRSER
jgi:hypothetical protein